METIREKTSKNNDFPGDTTQKNDKIQNRAKNVKKHEKTREIEIQYIYIYGEIPFLGIVKHRLQTMEDHSWQESSDSDQF